jgi:hypothetical protein
MKKQLTKTCLTVAIVVLAFLIGALTTAHADQASAQSQALAFIENVLPVDLTKYTINFEKYSTIDGKVGDLRYNLSSKVGTIDVTCKVERGILTYCHIYPMNVPVISDRHYANILDAVKSFLEKYQTYSKLDSTKLIAMLEEVDLTKNMTTIVDNTKLTVINYLSGDGITSLKWAYTEYGVDYTSLQLGFQKDGTFNSYRDDRAICTIGDTSINISKEQAIDIALKNLPSYSYRMPNQTIVSDFNVTEDKITASLAASPVRSNEFRPYWNVRMPLNQTYPGSVQGIAVFLWANTGKTISISNIAFGGAVYPDSSDPEAPYTPEAGNSPSIEDTSSPEASSSPDTEPTSTLPTETDSTPQPSTESDSSPADSSVIFAVAIAAVAVVLVMASAIIIKRK